MKTIQFEIPGFDELNNRIEELRKQIEELSQEKFCSSWLDNREFCKLLGISTRTAQNYRDRGMITFSQIGPKIYYKQAEIEAFLEQYKVKAFYSKSA